MRQNNCSFFKRIGHANNEYSFKSAQFLLNIHPNQQFKSLRQSNFNQTPHQSFPSNNNFQQQFPPLKGAQTQIQANTDQHPISTDNSNKEPII